MADVRGARRTLAGVRPGAALARVAELTMVVLGLGYVLLADDSRSSELVWLGWFDLVAVLYLGIGVVVVRRSALRQPDGPPHPPPVTGRPGRSGQRMAFALTVTASLTGLAGAIAITDSQDDPTYGPALTAIGVVAVAAAWLLLHVGYARYYSRLYERPDDLGRGIVFPRRPDPTTVDFLYFSFGLGVSFAVSDVEVVDPRWRWHVLVHTVVAFVYNAAVLAIAISVVTGR